MTSKTFVAGTVIDSAWLNDVNSAVYNSTFTRVEQYYVAGEIDSAPMFNRAITTGAATIYANGNYVIGSTPINIQSNQSLQLSGARFTTTSSTAILFSAVSVDDWSLNGPFSITGTGSSVGTAAAIYVAGCNRWRITQPTIKNIQGWDLKVDPGTPSGSARGDQGQVLFAQFHGSYYGYECTAGTGAEYCTLVAPHITGCVFPVVISAGNTTIVGGNVVDNTNGIYVGPGSNHAHGICSAVNINHNTNYNIKADTVTNGHTFIGCHVYANDAIGNGKIWISNSKGISFIGGDIDAMIQCDGTAGANYFKSISFPGTYTSKAGTNPEYLYVDNCNTSTGPSALNDASPVFSLAARSTSQALTAGGTTVAIMDSESVDNRLAYNNTTGVFTVPTPGTQTYKVDVFYTATAASGLTSAGSYVEVRNAGATAGYIPFSAISGTLAVASGTVTMLAANGAAIDVRVQINAGAVTPVLNASVSKQTISIVS